MPLARVMLRIFQGVGVTAALVFAANAWSQSSTARMPRDVRSGAIDMAIQRVEPEIGAEEIRAAVQAQLDRETMCFPWPSIWLAAGERRRVFIVRFDLMERDWGSDIAERARVRMQEFVDMGLLTPRDLPNLGPGAVEFRLTAEGDAALQGSASSGRLSFCVPSQRRVVEVTSTEFGTFACGTVFVRFTHSADAWPTWARTQTAQQRVMENWAPIGSTGEGAVSMSRQWFSADPPDGRENGQLRSLCYDAARRETRGEDMELFAAVPAQ